MKGLDRLQALDIDRAGAPAPPHELVSDGTLAPTELSLSLAGEMRYMLRPVRHSVKRVASADLARMQRAYLAKVKGPGAPLYVVFEGLIANRPRMEGPGVERTVVVTRFIDVRPDQQCEQARAAAALTNTYWRITSIGGLPVSATSGRREPHLLLRGGTQSPTFAAAIGCNQLLGGYALTGERITFTGTAASLMACPPPLDALERRLHDALTRARRWQINGHMLELRDDAGAQVALFEAVYL